MTDNRIVTYLGMAALAIVAYYLYKHGELANPTDMANEALKDAKDAGKKKWPHHRHRAPTPPSMAPRSCFSLGMTPATLCTN